MPKECLLSFGKSSCCYFYFIGSCNHVAGVLFRIEAAVLTGITHPTCTMQSSAYNVPSKKKQIIPGKLSNFLIKQDTYQKKFLCDSTKAKETHKRKLMFNPVNEKGKDYLGSEKKMRTDIYNRIKNLIPNSCFTNIMLDQSNIDFSVDKSHPNVPTMFDFAQSFMGKYPYSGITQAVVNDFNEHIKLTELQIQTVYRITQTQSESKDWVDLRKGRLTASKFNRIYTRINTLKNEPHQDHTALITEIMGYSSNTSKQQLWAIRHGIATEYHAKKKYLQLSKKQHKNMQSNDPGMRISITHPYISVTPDLEIECSCHGKGLVEINCPFTLIGKKPSHENYKHLIKHGDASRLKKTSEYYYQIQGQMAVTRRSYADFFVFTTGGFHVERIMFDESFWLQIQTNLVYCWENYVIPELLFPSVKSKPSENALIFIPKPNIPQIESSNTDKQLNDEALLTEDLCIILE